MIYEIAVLPVHSAQIEQFKQAFAEVVHLLQRLEKYFSQEPTVYHIQEAAFTNGNDQAFDIAVPKA